MAGKKSNILGYFEHINAKLKVSIFLSLFLFLFFFSSLDPLHFLIFLLFFDMLFVFSPIHSFFIFFIFSGPPKKYQRPSFLPSNPPKPIKFSQKNMSFS